MNYREKYTLGGLKGQSLNTGGLKDWILHIEMTNVVTEQLKYLDLQTKNTNLTRHVAYKLINFKPMT